MKKRPAIPEHIKRAVRQRCGFGCVICGIPLYEYEHMLEWAVVKRHVASEITLLCRFHHGQKTDLLLPKSIVEEANRNPFNLRAGVSSPLALHYSGKEVDLVIGGNSLNIKNLREGERFFPLIIDQVPIVEFRYQKGRLFLSLRVFDEENNLVLRVKDNEVVVDAGQWDVEWVGRTITIRQGLKRIFLKIKFKPPGVVLIEKGTILFNGIEILIGRDYFYNSNQDFLMQRCSVTNSNVAISVGTPPKHGVSLSIPIDINRAAIDRKAALSALRKKLAKSRLYLEPVELVSPAL